MGRASASVLNPVQSNGSSIPAGSINDAACSSCPRSKYAANGTVDEKANEDGLPLVMEVDMIEKTT